MLRASPSKLPARGRVCKKQRWKQEEYLDVYWKYPSQSEDDSGLNKAGGVEAGNSQCEGDVWEVPAADC